MKCIPPQIGIKLTAPELIGTRAKKKTCVTDQIFSSQTQVFNVIFRQALLKTRFYSCITQVKNEVLLKFCSPIYPFFKESHVLCFLAKVDLNLSPILYDMIAADNGYPEPYTQKILIAAIFISFIKPGSYRQLYKKSSHQISLTTLIKINTCLVFDTWYDYLHSQLVTWLTLMYLITVLS